MHSFHLFLVINHHATFQESLVLGADIPPSLWTGTWLAESDESVAGCALPNFFPVYFGEEVVYGDTRNGAVAETFAQLGLGYDVWLHHVVHSIDKLDNILHIVHMLEADKAIYFRPNWNVETSPPFVANRPCGTSIII